MNNLSFNKNNFVNREPAKLTKVIINDPNKLGRRTIEEIKHDMNSLNKNIKLHDNNKTTKQINQLESLKTFREWNKKWILKDLF